MIPLPQNDITALRSIKKTAILLLVLVRLNGAPVTAKDLADTLDMDYQTTRKHLGSLAVLGLVAECASGWIAAQGLHLLLSTTPVESAEISRRKPLLRSSASASAHSFLLEEEEEEEESEQERDKSAPLDQRCREAVEELEAAGVMVNGPVRELVRRSDWITGKYVVYQAERLEKQKKFSSGMLLRVCRDHDPFPDDEAEQKRRFLRSLDKFGIQH